MKTVCLDTNYLARYLAADNPVQGKQVLKLIQEGEEGKVQIYIDEIILAETIWLMTKYYKKERDEVCNALLDLIGQGFMINPRKDVINKALYLYQISNLSFPDCWIGSVAKANEFELKSFDKNLVKKISH